MTLFSFCTKESFLILCFYFLVSLSSIVDLGAFAPVCFLLLLVLCARKSTRTGAIVLLSMFYLPVAGLRIPNVFIFSTFIVALVNFHYVKHAFSNVITKWILGLYSLFLFIRFISIINVINLSYYWNYILISFSVFVHIVVFSCLIRRNNDVAYLIRWWGIIGALSAILGYLHFIFSDFVFLRRIVSTDALFDKATIDGSFDLVRWIWVGSEPNFTGLQLLIPLSINIGFLFRKISLNNLLLSAITMLGILGTYSRTSFLIAIFVILLFILMSNTKYKYWAICIIPFAIMAVSIYFPEFIERIYTIETAMTEGKGSGRFPLYLESFENFLENPFLGIGAGQTPIVSRFKLEAHNLFLQTLGENGIVGFICLITIFAKSLRQAYACRKLEPVYFIALLSVFLNCNSVSAFDLRVIFSLIIIISYSCYYQKISLIK